MISSISDILNYTKTKTKSKIELKLQIHQILGSHSGTVVPECYKDDVESQWESLKFDPPPSENAWTDGYQNWQGWLRPRYLPLCKIALRSD